MVDAADGLVFPEYGGDMEDRGAEFSTYEHDTERLEQIARFDSCSGGHFRKACFEGRPGPVFTELPLAQELDEKEIFSRRPFWPDGVEIDVLWRLEKETGLLYEVGQQVAAALDEVEHLLEMAG